MTPALRYSQLAVQVLVVGLAIWQIVTLAQCWWIRANYPYDIEWMEGATLISALRLTHGQAIYGVPDATYIPFIYPPLYPWLVAVFSRVFPFGYALGRSISIAGTLSGVAALMFGARELGAKWWLTLGCAAIFLGTFEDSGSFFDLVRIDGVSIGLTGWALVLAAGSTPGRAIAGGLFLAAAFTCKHHVAAFGFPIAAALWYRDGRAQALRFGLAAALPALLFIAVMQVGTDGRFLLWIFEVPSHHGIVSNRFWPTLNIHSWKPFRYETSGGGIEVFQATPILWVVAAGVWLRAHWRDLVGAGQRKAMLQLGGWLLGIGVLGTVVGFAVPGLRALVNNYAITALWIVLLSIGIVVALVQSGRARTPLATSPRFFYWFFVSLMGFFLASLMRGHVGGYTNVLMPMMWLQALWPALLVRRAGDGKGALALAFAVAAQIWIGHSDYKKDTPNADDVKQGDALIEELRALPDPLLLTDAPYYAVLSGHDPSFALIALWDISDRGCPPAAGVAGIHKLMQQQYWKSGVFPDGKPGSGIERGYHLARKLKTPGPRTLTGWPVKLRDIWEPKPASQMANLPPAPDDDAETSDPNAP